ALPAGEHLRLVAALGEDREHLVDVRRCDVVEARRVHGAPFSLRCPCGRRYMRVQRLARARRVDCAAFGGRGHRPDLGDLTQMTGRSTSAEASATPGPSS